MSRHFELGPFVTVALGIACLLAWTFATGLLSQALIASIDRTLGVDWQEVAAAAAAESGSPAGETPDAREVEPLEAWCRAGAPAEQAWDLQGVEELLHQAETDDAAAAGAGGGLFRTICRIFAVYRQAAARPTDLGAPAEKDARVAGQERYPMVPPYAEAEDLPERIEIDVARLDRCTQPLGKAALGFYPADCLLERIRGVGRLAAEPRGLDWLTSLAVLADASHSGLQGNAYAFRHSRAVLFEQDPSDVRWRLSKHDTPEPTDRALQIQTLQQALNRLDKLLLARVKQLEATVWGQRFVLRALNHPFQFVMFWLGLWAAALYGEQWRRARWGSDQASRLADWIRSQAPEGDDGGGKTRPNGASLPYSSELRNVVDSLHAGAAVRGRAIADTITEWIPMLGFIGTVFGMIGAMGAIGEVIAADQGPELYVAMGAVTSRLSLAFYTTFVGLILGLVLSFLYRMVLAQVHAAVQEAVREVRG